MDKDISQTSRSQEESGKEEEGISPRTEWQQRKGKKKKLNNISVKAHSLCLTEVVTRSSPRNDLVNKIYAKRENKEEVRSRS